MTKRILLALLVVTCAYAAVQQLDKPKETSYTEQKAMEANGIIKGFSESMKSFAAGLDKNQIASDLKQYGEPDETAIRFMKIQLPLMQAVKNLEPLGFKLTVQTGAFTASDMVPAIIDPRTKQLLGFCIIKRKDTVNGVTKETYATIGGFHEYGLTYAQNAAKEAREEVVIDIPEATITFAGLFDDPNRDPRQHVASLAFTGATYDRPQVTVEAHQVLILSAAEIQAIPKDQWFASDHKDIALAGIKIYQRNASMILMALENATPAVTKIPKKPFIA